MEDLSTMDLSSIFADLEGIPQDDGPSPVCAIAYPPDFVEAMNYFRAVLLAEEYSSRALHLTSICLKLNPANYTVWHFRRECLKAFSSTSSAIIDEDLVHNDLEFTATLGGSNPKNYQIWYHRRALLESILLEQNAADSLDFKKNASELTHKELMYTSGVLEEDSKNYHAWSHRQWILRCSINRTCDSLWREELSYAHSLILDDIRNNSAWNQRWFIVHKGTATPLSLEVAHKEAEYALDAAQKDPWNESPWSYFNGIVKEQLRGASTTEAEKQELLVLYEAKVKHIQEQQIKPENELEGEQCANILSSHIELLESKGDHDALTCAAQIANELALVHDRIRMKYWLYREKQLRDALGNITF